jgi:hypothetical protein
VEAVGEMYQEHKFVRLALGNYTLEVANVMVLCAEPGRSASNYLPGHVQRRQQAIRHFYILESTIYIRHYLADEKEMSTQRQRRSFPAVAAIS